MTKARGFRSVGIISIGLMTSVGRTAPAAAAAIRAGINRFRIGEWRDRFGQPARLALAQYLPSDLVGLDRLLALAIPAAREALAPLPRVAVRRLSTWLGVAPSRPGWSDALEYSLANRLVTALGNLVPEPSVRVLPTGHASVLIGISQAAEQIARGELDYALVGGVDSYAPVETLAWLDAKRRLLSEENSDGFIPGEAAGFCLLAALDMVGEIGLPLRAEVSATAVAEEPYPFTSEGICTAEGLTRAVSQALSHGDTADWTICDLNGESFRAQEWAYAYLRTAKSHGEPLQVWHPADCLGDVGAASGAVLVAIACSAIAKSYGRGSRPLLWASSDHGPRAAVLLNRSTS